MWEFIQANATWIILGVFFVLMLRMHGGAGCGMGHGGHEDQSAAKRRPGAADSEPDDAGVAAGQARSTKRSGGCH